MSTEADTPAPDESGLPDGWWGKLTGLEEDGPLVVKEILGAMEEARVDLLPPVDSPAQGLIIDECHAIRDMLLEKNKRYGNSALDPLRVFSSASTDEQLRTRIDDKLNRIMNQQLDDDEDAEADLIGYLILLRIHRRRSLQTDIAQGV